MKTLDDLFASFSSPEDFAAVIGVKVPAAKQMQVRRSIHIKHWPKLVQECKNRNIRGVNFDKLARLHLSDRWAS